ncbi:hypothetical protein BC941DRAFT_421522 [Chlamydoabsidia padenii]|nr:hypothetical protein BC941DRAFT_421522 [Chlamydoabsidia padenii]
MVEETSKKFAVGDMPPSPTTSNTISNTSNTHKKPTRHHVKRRSSGRVHVTKLAPMARAHIQQPTTEDDDNFEDIDQQQQQQQHAPRKPMKRSHSSKSIHRLSSNDPHRKVNLSGFTMTSKSTTSSSNNPTHHSPPITPTESQQKQKQKQQNTTDGGSTPMLSHHPNGGQASSPTPVPTNSLNCQQQQQYRSKPVTSPSFQVSHQAPAAPIAHMLNATANTLVTPDKPALANLATSNSSATGSSDISHTGGIKPRHLYSRFVDDKESDTVEQHRYHQQNQHQPQSMDGINLADVSDTVDKEYQSIQVYRDPMMTSLSRCMQQQQQRRQSNTRPPTSTHLHRLAQLGAQQRTFSSSILPTMASLTISSPPTDLPLQQNDQLTRQRYQRLLQANNISATNHHSSSTTAMSAENKQMAGRWSAGAFLDRMFYGVS